MQTAASPVRLEEYDVIICGGGTAGCVLANRLSADPTINVLMLEAGENANNDPRVSTPGLFALLYDDPERDWSFLSEPSPAMNGRTEAHSRGKCIGGSSAINLMGLIYPSRTSIDAWAELGNVGWSWNELLPYYRKTTRRYPPPKDVQDFLGLDPMDEHVQNKDGPIASSFPSLEPIGKAWIETWRKLGKTWRSYPLGEHSTMGGYLASSSVNPEKGERAHAGVGYYAPVAHRENLHVVTGAMIDKIELHAITPGSVIATAVTFFHGGQSYTVRAKQEIILTAGVFGSPAILERSGIGSKAVCENAGVLNIVDLPSVGENLQDHLVTGLCYEVKDGIPTADMMRDPQVAQMVMEMYQTSRTGPLAGGGFAMSNTPLGEFITPLPELKQLLDKHLPATRKPGYPAEQKHEAYIRSVLESPEEASASYCVGGFQVHGDSPTGKGKFAFAAPGNYVTLLPALAHPFSRGQVHIKSADSAVYPKIACNYGEHPLDIEILARHTMQCEKLAATAPFSDLLKPGGNRLPAGKDAKTLEGAIDIVRSSGFSNYHPCGTCAMMPKELGGVVDDRLRVYGVKGLRVCDASIFPIIVRGNIMSTVYAVAEKGSDILKEDLKAHVVNGGH